MAKKVLDPKAQAKKQKKRAIIAGVIFLALLAYQVPKTMKMLNAKPVLASTSPARAATPTPAPATPTATATPGATPVPGAPTTGAPTTGTGADAIVVNADLSPVPLDGQLATLTQFTSKDPFKQQDTAGGSSTPAAATPPTSTTPTPNSPPGGGSFTTPGTSPPGSGSGTATPAPAPTLGTISINNIGMAVTVKADFPTDSPLFTLVSLTSKAAKIAIAGGSLATGSQTVTLPLGKPVTLMNTADGTRYVLVYVGPGDKTAPAAASATTTATTTTTPTPTTPAPVATAGR
jgi:hypothetical protein